jgi:orotate phosphoribosyltransferase
VQAVGVVDRLQGGRENFEARRIPFRSLLTVDDLGVPRQDGAQ